MCAGCIMVATTAAAGAAGGRWVLVAKFKEKLGQRGKRALSAVLIVSGVLAAGLVGPNP